MVVVVMYAIVMMVYVGSYGLMMIDHYHYLHHCYDEAINVMAVVNYYYDYHFLMIVDLMLLLMYVVVMVPHHIVVMNLSMMTMLVLMVLVVEILMMVHDEEICASLYLSYDVYVYVYACAYLCASSCLYALSFCHSYLYHHLTLSIHKCINEYCMWPYKSQRWYGDTHGYQSQMSSQQ
jgi:hypothetical protein